MTRYAIPEVTVFTLVGAVATFAVGALLGAWLLAPLALTLALLAFYRDPPRDVPDEPRALLAAADGVILRVLRNQPGPDGRPELRICIFLSVLNVHVNRSPCAGVVTALDYRPGRFLNALKAEATDQNESNTVTLDPAGLPGPVRVRQIAGVLARRIVCAVRTGEKLSAGQRFGMIKLGSQTEVCVPEDPRWEVLVRDRQVVRGGRTVLARLRES